MLRHRSVISPRPHRRATAAVIGAALGVTLLAGCGAGNGASTTSSAQLSDSAGGADSRGSAPQAATDGAAKAAEGAGTATSIASQAELQRKLTRQADVSLTVKAVPKAAAEIRSITAAARGIVLSEQINTTPPPDAGSDPSHARSFSTMTISVPSSALDATLDRLGQVGTVESRSTSTEDVTASYVDTQSRLATMRASIARIRALMSRATKIGDIVSLESELSRREADLESLQAQLNALDGAVAMSPVTIRLATVAPPTDQPRTGFLGGLVAGWDAFTASGTFLLTALGALLPFLLALAVVLMPLWLWVRRRRVGAPPPAQA